MDVLIRGGLIVDGTGRAPFYGDIAVERDRIAAIGRLEGARARMVIDARGLTVTPGLIDGHTHSELGVIKNRQYPCGVYQGVSTIVTGQCGLGFAPFASGQTKDSLRMNSGIFGSCGQYGKGWGWEDFRDFLSALDGCAVNVGANVSHNAVRQAACGFEDRPLEGASWKAAEAALRNAMEAGATGLSVGLSYYPGGYSDTEELVRLCRVVKEYDGIFCVHLRLADGSPALAPAGEIAEVIARTHVRLHMLHYKTGGMENYRTLFKPFEKLLDQGEDIHFEYYPYLTGAGLLLALIPGWAQEGGYEKIMERLTDPGLRPVLLRDMELRHPYFFGEGQTAKIIQTADPYSEYLGKTVTEIAGERGESFSEAVLRLLVENDLEAGFAGIENQTAELREKLYEDQYHLFLDENYTVGSDTIPDNLLCHPRCFGTFPRIIRQMRERKVPVETIIRKLTSVSAGIYRIPDRGTLEEGKMADICIMNYAEVSERADYVFGRKKPDGILHLLVNGLPVLLDGALTGILSGQSVKREAKGR